MPLELGPSEPETVVLGVSLPSGLAARLRVAKAARRPIYLIPLDDDWVGWPRLLRGYRPYCTYIYLRTM